VGVKTNSSHACGTWGAGKEKGSGRGSTRVTRNMPILSLAGQPEKEKGGSRHKTGEENTGPPWKKVVKNKKG